MKGECSMTALEASRLIDWLKAHGHTDADATECIKTRRPRSLRNSKG